MLQKSVQKKRSELLAAPLTQKGQVTIPKAIRMVLKLWGNRMVGFKVSHGKVEIVPVEIKSSSYTFTEQEWGKIEKLSRQKGRTYDSAEKAKQYARSL